MGCGYRLSPFSRRRLGLHRDQTGDAVSQETDRSRLEALRARLEGVLHDPETPPRDLASVAREYRQLISALAALAPADGKSQLDEIAARRRKRGASS